MNTIESNVNNKYVNITNETAVNENQSELTNESINNTVIERRQCWLCLGQEEIYRTEADGHHFSDHWLTPCRCKGTAKWIHNECLQLWIDEKQKLDTSIAVKCSQCNTQYVLVFPPNGKLIDIIFWYETVVNNVSTYAMVLCIAGSIYMSAFSYGILTCLQIMGTEKTNELIDNSSKTLALICLPSIPFALFAGKLIQWESVLLRLWRKHYRRVPFISYLTGCPVEGLVRENIERNLLGLDNAIQIERNNGVINHIEINVSGTSICRAFCGALLLPTFAKIVGKYLFSSVESDLNKTLLGGLTFIVIKGGLKIYLRQQQFIRQTQRKILNYSEFRDLDENN